MEAAIVEQLRRSGNIQLHDTLINALLIYQESGRRVLGQLYQDYINVAKEAGLPFIMSTPTWRANRYRVDNADIGKHVNHDAVAFMNKIRDRPENHAVNIKLGGMIGCKNDCYLPSEGLSETESTAFHSWQINQLAEGDIDFLIAETLPNVAEATGIAKAMENTGLPYIISFVINRQGLILDGTSLNDAINIIDTETTRNPTGYMINCSYPSFLRAGQQPAEVLSRLVGCQANASSMDHCELDNSENLRSENIAEWGEDMLVLNRTFGIPILGGCCGTGVEHLRYIINN